MEHTISKKSARKNSYDWLLAISAEDLKNYSDATWDFAYASTDNSVTKCNIFKQIHL
jgi:hypothetical protein